MTPIERAEHAISAEAFKRAVSGEDLIMPYRMSAELALESIDTGELVQALVDDGWENLDEPLTKYDLTLIALAVKNWLTGKDQQ